MNRTCKNSETRRRCFTRQMSKALFVALLMVLSVCVCGKTTSWTGLGSGDSWATTGNWNNGVPATGDDVIIPDGSSVTITYVPGISLNSLSINRTCTFQAASSGNILTVTGSFSVASGVNFTVGASGGRLNLTLSSTAIGIINGTGVVTQSAGTTTRTFTCNGDLSIAPGAYIDGAGAFTLNSGATLRVGSGAGIVTGTTTTGNIQVTGTRTYSAGANYIYNGTANQVTGNGLTQNQPANVTINNPGNTVSLSGNRSISGNLSILAGTYDLSTFTMNRSASGGTLSISDGATLRIGGTNPAPTNFGRSFATNSTVEYYGAAQSIGTETFGNLLISAGTKSTTGTVTINGDFTLSSGAVVNTGNSWNPAGNWTVDGSFNQTGGTTTFSTGVTHTLAGNGYSQFNILVTSSSTINAGSHDIRIAGNWTHGTAGTFNAQTSTVTFNGSGNQTQPNVGFVPSLYNMVINKSGGTMSSRVWTVSNNFELLNGALSPGNGSSFNNITLSAGTFTAPAGITVSGNWLNNNAGSFVAGSGTVTFNGTATQSIGGSAATTFFNLAIATGSVANLGSLAHTANTLTLGGIGRANGSWGHPNSTATYKNNVYFAANTGTVNVSTGTCTAPAMMVQTSNVSCFGGNDGSITVTVTGGVADYEFSINGGSTWTSPQASNQYTFNNLTVAGGPYTIAVRDASGCVQTNCE